MGRVYEAEHIDIGKRVALKILHPAYSQMPDLVERFRREARAASKIGHPNIVDVTDSGTTPDGAFFFVMEYLEGVELGELIDREKRLDIRRALIIGDADLPRAAGGARGQRHPPRSQARERLPDSATASATSSRCSTSASPRAAPTAIEREPGRAAAADPPGHGDGHARVHGARAGRGQARRPALRRLRGRRDPVRDADRAIRPYEGENFMEILNKKANSMPAPLSTVRDDVPAAARGADHEGDGQGARRSGRSRWRRWRRSCRTSRCCCSPNFSSTPLARAGSVAAAGMLGALRARGRGRERAARRACAAWSRRTDGGRRGGRRGGPGAGVHLGRAGEPRRTAGAVTHAAARRRSRRAPPRRARAPVPPPVPPVAPTATAPPPAEPASRRGRRPRQTTSTDETPEARDEGHGRRGRRRRRRSRRRRGRRAPTARSCSRTRSGCCAPSASPRRARSSRS